MNRIATAVLALTMSACTMTPTQKRLTGIVAGVLVVGAIAAERADNGEMQSRVPTPSVNCQPNPELCR